MITTLAFELRDGHVLEIVEVLFEEYKGKFMAMPMDFPDVVFLMPNSSSTEIVRRVEQVLTQLYGKKVKFYGVYELDEYLLPIN